MNCARVRLHFHSGLSSYLHFLAAMASEASYFWIAGTVLEQFISQCRCNSSLLRHQSHAAVKCQLQSISCTLQLGVRRYLMGSLESISSKRLPATIASNNARALQMRISRRSFGIEQFVLSCGNRTTIEMQEATLSALHWAWPVFAGANQGQDCLHERMVRTEIWRRSTFTRRYGGHVKQKIDATTNR
jgi:hypothetical protein